MAMNRKPKPLRPDPTKANYKGNTGKNPVVKITKVTRPLKKATVKNPSAPSAAAPRGGGVRVITKSETFMKKDKARSAKTGSLPLTKTVTDSMKTSGKKSYKSDPKTVSGQAILNNPKGSNVQKMVPNKGNKPTKITPKKKAEAPKKAAPKRRLFVGRGRGGGGDELLRGVTGDLGRVALAPSPPPAGAEHDNDNGQHEQDPTPRPAPALPTTWPRLGRSRGCAHASHDTSDLRRGRVGSRITSVNAFLTTLSAVR
jgi:hypothetical protein